MYIYIDIELYTDVFFLKSMGPPMPEMYPKPNCVLAITAW